MEPGNPAVEVIMFASERKIRENSEHRQKERETGIIEVYLEAKAGRCLQGCTKQKSPQGFHSI